METKDLLNRLKALGLSGYGNSQVSYEAARQIEKFQKALRLAVNLLSIHEPPDSRAVSDDFVALAAVDTGDISDEVMAVIDKGLARQAESGAASVGGPDQSNYGL